MKTIALVLIVFLASANAMTLMEKFPVNFSSKRSIMNVMIQVEAVLKANGPMDLITDTLKEFESEITNEQIQADQLHDRQAKECVEEEEFRNNEIDDAQSALDEGQETLDGCNAQLNRGKSDLTTCKKNLNTNINSLTAAKTSRRRDNYAYETFVGKYKMISKGIDEAQDFLTKLLNGEGAFVQLAKHANKMLISAAQINKAHFLAPIVSTMAQIAQAESTAQANQALFNKLGALFEGLRNKYADEYDEKTTLEAEQQAEFEATSAKLQANIDRLTEQQADLESEIDQLKKCITVQTNIVSSARQKKERNSRLLNDANQLCAGAEKAYVIGKKGRMQELDLLGAIKAKVAEHYKQISSGVTERGEQDADEWEQESLEYEEAEFAPAY